MAISPDSVNMALFCDFENVALGVRDANYEKFDIKLVLERLLLKGSIVVKKAYCDWERYKGFKAAMHEANFELIEIPHVRQSGKNSADIRLVVDALDLCYTKSHVDTFVIISGDSDFSPLVSKLRENAKQVIGVGVKHSTSDLLVANCDEFIFYDDLVRETPRAAPRRDGKDGRDSRDPASGQRRASADDERRRKSDKDDLDARRSKAIAMVVETFDALMAERGDTGKIWASVVKQTLKRRRPDFSESYYGFKSFGNLLDEAQRRGQLECGRDEKSGAYVYRPGGLSEDMGDPHGVADAGVSAVHAASAADPAPEPPRSPASAAAGGQAFRADADGWAPRAVAALPDDAMDAENRGASQAEAGDQEGQPKSRGVSRRTRGGRKKAAEHGMESVAEIAEGSLSADRPAVAEAGREAVDDGAAHAADSAQPDADVGKPSEDKAKKDKGAKGRARKSRSEKNAGKSGVAEQSEPGQAESADTRQAAASAEPAAAAAPDAASASSSPVKKAVKKTVSRARRPRKTAEP